MRPNRALAAWRQGERTIGVWLSLANVHIAETLANLGFDWLCMDLQHGLLDYKDLTLMLPAVSAAKTTPLVRVPWNEPYEIMKALDAGAYGVIVPMINSGADARQAVAACRYPPAGNRSFGPVRAALHGGREAYAKGANDQIACIAMIETAQGLENLDEIAATPGLDGVYIGPNDLALAIGLAPQGDNDDPAHAEAVQLIQAACRKRGVAVGVHSSSLAFAQRHLRRGFQFVTLGSDMGFLSRTASQELAAARSAAAGKD